MQESLIGKTLYVAIHEHQYGNTVRVFVSPLSVEKWRQEIAREYWADMFHTYWIEEMPKDRKEAADMYFEAAGNNGIESFIVFDEALEQ